jgi:hypothetical protein
MMRPCGDLLDGRREPCGDLAAGRRITGLEVMPDGRILAAAGTAGVRRRHDFAETGASRPDLTLTGPAARLASLTAYRAGVERPPALEARPAKPTDPDGR